MSPTVNRALIPLLLVWPAAAALAAHELDGRDLAAGARVYAEHCAACHGADLEGQPDWQRPDETGLRPAPPHDETGHTWHHDNAFLFAYTKFGGERTLAALGVTGVPSGMPAFGPALSDDDIWNVLAYIRSTWPERIRQVQAERNAPH